MAFGGLMFGVELAAWERERSQGVRLFAAPDSQSQIFIRQSARRPRITTIRACRSTF
jgi:hypothetical protein